MKKREELDVFFSTVYEMQIGKKTNYNLSDMLYQVRYYQYGSIISGLIGLLWCIWLLAEHSPYAVIPSTLFLVGCVAHSPLLSVLIKRKLGISFDTLTYFITKAKGLRNDYLIVAETIKLDQFCQGALQTDKQRKLSQIQWMYGLTDNLSNNS